MSDQKVATIIKERFFGPDTFQYEQYKSGERYLPNHRNPFENQIRREQMATEMETVIRQSEQVSEEELKKAFSLQ